MYLTSPSVDSVQKLRYSTHLSYYTIICLIILIPFVYGDYASVLYRVYRLQGRERDRRLPDQSSLGGAGLQAGPLGVDQRPKQTLNLLLVSVCSM